MSLRAEIHAALDDVTPPAPDLQRRVTSYVTADDRDRVVHLRRRRARWTTPLRGSLALLAAVLIVVLMAGALFGVRLIRDWNGFHSSHPAGGVNQPTLAQLEAIPLRWPILSAGDPCPIKPGVNALGYDYGSGPIYVNGRLLPELSVQNGAFYELTYYSDSHLTGLVLIRGRDLVNGRPIRFVSQTEAGFSSTTSPMTTELVLDAGHPPLRDAATRYGIWHVRHWIDAPWSGCWGFQIDGSNFSQTITGYVRPF